MNQDDMIGVSVERQRERERNLRIRLEELCWVNQQINFPNEVEPALGNRIEQYKLDLASAQEYGD